MRKAMILVFCFVFSILTFNVSAQTEKVNEEYKQELLKYYQVSGADVSISVTIETVMTMIPGLTDEEKSGSFKEIMEKVMKEVIEAVTPIYQKHISLADLKELNKFYSTPAGKRLAASMPAISKESVALSMSLGQKMQTIIQDILAQKK